MDKLKELLGEELHAQFLAKIGSTKVIIDDGTYVHNSRLSEVIAEKKAALEQNKILEANINTIKAEVESIPTLKAKIADMQTLSEQAKKEAEALTVKAKKLFALKEMLMDSGVEVPADRELLVKDFEVEKLELDESGKIKGSAELVEQKKKTYPKLFGSKKFAGQEHQKSAIEGWNDPNPFSKATRNITKQIELKRTNPELAKRLEESAK